MSEDLNTITLLGHTIRLLDPHRNRCPLCGRERRLFRPVDEAIASKIMHAAGACIRCLAGRIVAANAAFPSPRSYPEPARSAARAVLQRFTEGSPDA